MLIKNGKTREVAELFDDLYVLMVRMLAYVAGGCSDRAVLARFAVAAITMMPTVVLPLGEGLAQLPVSAEPDGRTAGAAFGLTRHVLLPPDGPIALKVVRERLGEIIESCHRIERTVTSPPQIGRVHGALLRIARILS
jgi:hypothetical protein